MPQEITYADWQTASAKIPDFKKSSQLQELNTAFKLYSELRAANKLETLRVKFEAWHEAAGAAPSTERRQLVSEMQRLEYTLEKAAAATPAPNTVVRPQGWAYVAWDKTTYPWTTRLLTDLQPDALTGSEISRINESLRRVLRAIELARDAMVLIAKRKLFTAPLGTEEASYVDFFGAYSEARVATVLRNYRVLHLAFQHTPRLVDVRNTVYGKQVYAACFRKDLGALDAHTKSLSVTGQVEMFLGRSFFKGGSYESTTDTTIATLVHEFSHGAVNAVDAPRVLGGAWELQPKQLTNPAHNDYGETPENFKQSSTVDLDKALAAFAPDIAVRNADCYGQFAKECLIRATG